MIRNPLVGKRPGGRRATTEPRIATTNPTVRAVAIVLLAVTWGFTSATVLRAQSGAGAQGDPDPDPWEPFRLLEGTWEGAIDGRLGQGVGRRRYEFILEGRYLVSRHASVRLPQDASPEGDHHRELAVYSYDRERDTIVLREFMVEGYVLRSTCATEPRRFVCTAKEIESGSGMQARLTVEIVDPYRFEETFELASPGEELQVYFTDTWTRVPDLEGAW